MPVLQHQQGVSAWAPQAFFSPQSGQAYSLTVVMVFPMVSVHRPS